MSTARGVDGVEDPVPVDPVMARIGQGQQQAMAGDRAGAAAVFAAVWEEIGGEGGDPLHVVSLAHYLADLQDDPLQELAWDRRALRAADALTDERVKEHHSSLAVRGFYPSLHLNLAADHAKLGDRSAALHHLDRAEAALPDLPDQAGREYGELIRAGISRLRGELEVHP